VKSKLYATATLSFAMRQLPSTTNASRRANTPYSSLLSLHDVSIELLDYIKLIGELRAL
jgi:hypothetical protein